MLCNNISLLLCCILLILYIQSTLDTCYTYGMYVHTGTRPVFVHARSVATRFFFMTWFSRTVFVLRSRKPKNVTLSKCHFWGKMPHSRASRWKVTRFRFPWSILLCMYTTLISCMCIFVVYVCMYVCLLRFVLLICLFGSYTHIYTRVRKGLFGSYTQICTRVCVSALSIVLGVCVVCICLYVCVGTH
jgi:hypothetical protein